MLTVGLALAVIAGAADVLAGLLATAIRLTRRNLEVLVALGAGFILAAALLDLIPEVIEEDAESAPLIALGYLALFVTESVFSRWAHGEKETGNHRHGHALVERPHQETHAPLTLVASLTALLGLTVHAFFDGVAIMSGWEQASGTGLLIFIAVLFHKLPEGFSLAAIMLAAGRRRATAALATALLGVATVLGGVTVLGLGGVSPGLTTGFLAFAAGTFLYVGATDLVPAANARPSRLSLALVLLGFAVYFGLIMLLEAAGLSHE